MIRKEQLKELHNTLKAKATEQLIKLIELHEENKEYFRHDSYAFIPARGYQFNGIVLREDKIFAMFLMRGWEHNSTYYLDMDSGYKDEMAKMQMHIDCAKDNSATEEIKEALLRREQYEQLKKEFE